MPDLPPELIDGLIAGGLAALLMLVVVPVWRAQHGSGAAPGAGLLLAAAAVGAIAQQRHLPPEVLVAVIGVGAAAALSRWRRGAVVAPLLALPFAWLLAHESSSTTWVQGVVLVAAWLGSVAACHTERIWRLDAVTPALFAITAGGVLLAVPDTEEAAALLGAAIPLALCGWPLRLVTLGRSGAAAATALLAWVVAVGGRGRPPSIVGALACLALLVGLAAGGALRTRLGALVRSLPPAPVPAVLAVHAAIVLVASRVAGITSELHQAIPVAVACLAAAVVAGSLLRPPTPMAARRPDAAAPPIGRSLLGPTPGPAGAPPPTDEGLDLT